MQVSFAKEVQVELYGKRPPTDGSALEMSESEGGACKSDWESGKEEDWTDQRPPQPQSSQPSQVIASQITAIPVATHLLTHTGVWQ